LRRRGRHFGKLIFHRSHAFGSLPESGNTTIRLTSGVIFGDLRQKPGIGRKPIVNKRPGRSLWPEPDTIRRIIRECPSRHSEPIWTNDWFPRADFGLPIQTEFKDAPGVPEAERDPEGKFLLRPDDADRWPSPVLLKVIPLKEGLLQACLILNVRPPDSLELLRKNEGRPDRVYHIPPAALPGVVMGKTPPPLAPIEIGEGAYDALIRHLHLESFP
jgi:CRISPR-associated protein Cmr1